MIVEKEKLLPIERESVEYKLEQTAEIPRLSIRTKINEYYINFQFPLGESTDFLLQGNELVQSLFPQREATRMDGVELAMQYIERIKKTAEVLDGMMEKYSICAENDKPFFELVPFGKFRFQTNGTVRNLPIDIFILSQFFSNLSESLVEELKERGDRIYPLSPDVQYPIYFYKEDLMEKEGGYDFFLLVADAKSVKDLGEEK